MTDERVDAARVLLVDDELQRAALLRPRHTQVVEAGRRRALGHDRAPPLESGAPRPDPASRSAAHRSSTRSGLGLDNPRIPVTKPLSKLFGTCDRALAAALRDAPTMEQRDSLERILAPTPKEKCGLLLPEGVGSFKDLEGDIGAPLRGSHLAIAGPE